MTLIPVNPTDREWTQHRYLLAFGPSGRTRLMVWGNSLDSALDECIDWIAEHAPGILCDDEVNAAYSECIEAGESEESARESSEMDTTCAGNAGNYIHSWEWAVIAEDPTRAQVLEIQGRTDS